MKLPRTIEFNAINAALLSAVPAGSLSRLARVPHSLSRSGFGSWSRLRPAASPVTSIALSLRGEQDEIVVHWRWRALAARHEAVRMTSGWRTVSRVKLELFLCFPELLLAQTGCILLIANYLDFLIFEEANPLAGWPARSAACKIRTSCSPRSTKSERKKLTLAKHPGSSSCG